MHLCVPVLLAATCISARSSVNLFLALIVGGSALWTTEI